MGLFHVHSHPELWECQPDYIWARGPVCHLISEAVELAEPIRCRGGQGLWQLEDWQLAKVREQLQSPLVVERSFDLGAAVQDASSYEARSRSLRRPERRPAPRSSP